jgi:hypothetical protein
MQPAIWKIKVPGRLKEAGSWPGDYLKTMRTIGARFMAMVILAALLVEILTPMQGEQARTCQQPGVLTSAYCQQMETLLLNATVRVEVQSWRVAPAETGYDILGSVGHATVQDGRYLVTHNHFSTLDLSQPVSAESEAYTRLLLYDADGEFLLAAPLIDFVVMEEGAEKLVIELKEEDARAVLASRGVTSGCFESQHLISLTPGIEVAQVDWDGSNAHVDWVSVQKIIVVNDVPCLLLSEGVTPGASGGGIFLDGVHVATTWAVVEQLDINGNVLQRFTLAALDEQEGPTSNKP